MDFLGTCYQNGLQAFSGTPINCHLTQLYRLIVHHCRNRGPKASLHLLELAEAFTECQAVQARAIEKLGLEIIGVSDDFRGLLVRLLGDYKSMAVKMLALERVRTLGLQEDATPTHYENRLTADLGQRLGLNLDDIRRAELDEHAESRFQRLTPQEGEQAAMRARELLDLGAAIKALVAELNSFGAASPGSSMSRQFLDWVDQRFVNKHIVFDSVACSLVDVGDSLVLAVLEDVFLGEPEAPVDETYRGERVAHLFKSKQG